LSFEFLVLSGVNSPKIQDLKFILSFTVAGQWQIYTALSLFPPTAVFRWNRFGQRLAYWIQASSAIFVKKVFILKWGRLVWDAVLAYDQ
jgi:hypothetical protein